MIGSMAQLTVGRSAKRTTSIFPALQNGIAPEFSDGSLKIAEFTLAAMTEPSEVQPPGQKQDEHDDQDDAADPGRCVPLCPRFRRA
jgi:hypothetical protein